MDSKERRRGAERALRAPLACAVAAWAAALAMPAAHAQAAPDRDAVIQEGLRRQEERERISRERNEFAPNVLRAPETRTQPSPLEPEAPCFVIQEIRLEGAGWERFAWIADAAAPYLRQCIGVRGLSRIASQLDASLLERGFATSRVSLPQQNLQSGTLLVHVHVGRIGAVTGASRNAFPSEAGEVLNIRDIEQGVEQMRRLPSRQVAARLEPGTEPDTSNVIVETRTGGLRERLRGGVTLDNSGSRAMGRAQLSGQLALDDALGLDDILAANISSNLQQPTGSHRSQSLGLNWSMPWGYSLLSIGASENRFAQYVQGTTARFLNSGHSETADLHLTRTVWRNSSAKLAIAAGVSVRRARSFIDDVELVVQRRRTTQGDVALSWKQIVSDTASFDAEAGMRRGLSWNAQEDLATAAMGGPTLRPRIATLSASYTTQVDWFAKHAQYTMSLRGQSTHNTTLAIDQFGIGGRYSVRGFDGDTVLLAESGATLHNDFSVPVQLWSGANTAWTFALDAGRVWGPSDIYLPGHMLAGIATGIRGSAFGLLFDISLAAPLSRPARFTAQPWVAYASFTYPF